MHVSEVLAQICGARHSNLGVTKFVTIGTSLCVVCFVFGVRACIVVKLLAMAAVLEAKHAAHLVSIVELCALSLTSLLAGSQPLSVMER